VRCFLSDHLDIVRVPASRIVEVARLAFETPDVDFLCFGESDQPSPESARDAAVAALLAGDTRYGDVRGLPALRDALAGYLTGLHARPVTESRVQVTASGMVALSVALAATVRAGDRVVVHTPAWPNAGNAAIARGAVLEELGLDRAADGTFRLDLDRLDAMMKGARAFLLNTPNNPTGWTATEADLRAILAITRRHGAWLISDEVYTRIVYDGRAAAPSLLDIAEPDDRVLVCDSFSKTWNMTGWRLGWLVVPEGARDAFTNIVEVTHSPVAPFTQRAGVAAVGDEAAVTRLRDYCAAGRDLVGQALAGVNGVQYAPPDGAFYAFVGVEGVTDSVALAKALVARHKVAVAPGRAFGSAGEGSLRICFAQSPERIGRAMERLREGLRAEVG
jgi:aspartate/methionine/tyrosine aminotransferase